MELGKSGWQVGEQEERTRENEWVSVLDKDAAAAAAVFTYLHSHRVLLWGIS